MTNKGQDEQKRQVALPPPNVTRRWLRFLFPVIAMVITLVLADIGLQLYRPVHFLEPPRHDPDDRLRGELVHRRSAVPDLDYELTPGVSTIWRGKPVLTNRWGMRDREPLPNNTPGLFRIVILGDSVTFGYGIDVHDTYPNVLEELLAASTDRAKEVYDVLNLGVSGYSTKDEALVLEHTGLGWDPDIVIVGYYLNDPETTPSGKAPLSNHFHDVESWRHSNLIRAVARIHNLWEIRRLGGGDYVKYLHAPQGRKWKTVTTAFQRIHALTTTRRIPVVVVIFPFTPDGSWEGYPYRSCHQVVRAAAEELGFTCLDLLEEFSRHDGSQLRLSKGDGHPNELAHAIAAREIQELLMEKFLEMTR